ncbi:MAG: hypothetical protein JW789_02665 [Candidatus Aenigmarchaeota archaeon]|nr:hypothetical protein [Candidatus Aenigmarchaeota archaeon]
MFGLEENITGMVQDPALVVFLVLFFVFILLAYKVVKILVRALIISAIAGVFPVFSNMFFGTAFPITIDSMLWFAMTGAEIYFVYHILVSIGTIAEFVMKPFSKGKMKKVEKVIIVEKKKDNDEKGKES